MIALKSLIAVIRPSEIQIMASLTIRNLEEDTKQRLRVRAALHGRSMEEEVREILRRSAAESLPPRNLAAAIRSRFPDSARVDLPLTAREAGRHPPDFGGPQP